MTVHSELVAILDTSLRAAHFRRRADNWFHATESLYVVVNLQKSNFDELHFINIGFSRVAATKDGWLPERRCQVRFRAERICSIGAEDINLLDPAIYARTDSSTWSTAVTGRVVEPVVSVVTTAVDLPSLKKVLDSRVSSQVFISRELRQELAEAN